MKTTRFSIILSVLALAAHSHAADLRPTRLRLVGAANQIDKDCQGRVAAHIQSALEKNDAYGGEAVGAVFSELSAALRESGLTKPRIRSYTQQVQIVLDWMKTQRELKTYHQFLMAMSEC